MCRGRGCPQCSLFHSACKFESRSPFGVDEQSGHRSEQSGQGVVGGDPTNTPTVPVIDMTEADSVRDENSNATFRELDSDTVSVESLVGSAVEVPQSGDEVMSDPDPEVVEAHSSVAVQLAFSTLDEVDFTRILDCVHP